MLGYQIQLSDQKIFAQFLVLLLERVCLSFYLFFFLSLFYWSIIALQCYVSLYCITNYISYLPPVLCSVVSKSFVTPWTVTHQAPLSMEFSRQKYQKGLPFHILRYLPDSVIEPPLLHLPHWQVILYHCATWEALASAICIHISVPSWEVSISFSSAGPGSSLPGREAGWSGVGSRLWFHFQLYGDISCFLLALSHEAYN